MPFGTINGQLNIVTTTAAPTLTTTSLSDLSTGVGITISAQYTGRYLIFFQTGVSNNTANDGTYVSVYRVTGSSAIPAGNAATTGTQLTGSNPEHTSATANAIGNCSGILLDTPGIGTVTYYVAYRARTGGTSTLTPTNNTTTITAIEV